MKYTVVWSDPATNRLTDIYNRATDGRAVQTAADQIDLELKNNADHVGASLGGMHRWLHIPPLLVIFSADPGDCMARVLKVGYVP